ncbi:MAG: hypothetical protein EPO00_09325 [Chloroflexota bacterium]|nr:MAG: hypothetical protein EPO00_09325 [Chloroflexota bacterium]
MPDLRAIIVALGVGIGLAAYTVLWWHWPLALGGGVGIVMGGLTLVGSVSFGPNTADADAAWRAAAPEFTDPPASPRSDAGPMPIADPGQNDRSTTT